MCLRGRNQLSFSPVCSQSKPTTIPLTGMLCIHACNIHNHAHYTCIHAPLCLRDQDLIVSIVDRLGRFEVSRTVCDTTMHVVCGNPRRTINILAATAMGCWILSTDWVHTVTMIYAGGMDSYLNPD